MSKTRKENFTVKLLESLNPETARYNVFDTGTRGLGIVVHPSGTKVFFHLKKVQGWPRRSTLEKYPDMTIDQARGKAAELNGKLAKWKSNNYEGVNPVEKPRNIPTLGDVFENYLEHHLKANAKNPDHATKYARWQFKRYLGSWRNRPLPTIRREHVRERHEEILKQYGKVTANRTITFLRTLINHAIHPDVNLWEGVNVAKDPNKFLEAESGRDRTLKKEEYRPFFEALRSRKTHPDMRDITWLALLTGQRRGSILKMRWKDLDLRVGLWTVTERKGKKKKANQPDKLHIIPLVDEAIRLLKRRPRLHEEWVFPGRKGALTTIKKPWQQFIKRTGIEGLTFHDLRRSLATAEGDAGASKEVIQKTLGHTEDSTATRIYDQSDRRQEVRAALKQATRPMVRAGKRKMVKSATHTHF